jgi:hypothetical protein
MRNDMAQLLVEHPRHKAGELYREHRRRANREPEEAPLKQGMRRPYFERKQFGEFFAPVKGYLRKSVGRPWDKVFSELSASLHGGGAVVDHVKIHVLRDFVILQPAWHDGVACYPPHSFSGFRSKPTPIVRRFNDGLYVDRQGILRQAPVEPSRKPRKSKPIGIVIDTHSAYYKIDAVWYRVWFKPLPAAGPDMVPMYDLVLKSWVRCKHYPPTKYQTTDLYRWEVDKGHGLWELSEAHGSDRIAYRREQIGSRVIRRERLNERLVE